MLNALLETSIQTLLSEIFTTTIIIGTYYIISETYKSFINLEFHDPELEDSKDPQNNFNNNNNSNNEIINPAFFNDIFKKMLENESNNIPTKSNVKKFINNNFLENIFQLEDIQIYNNITTILSNESFYKFLKLIYSNEINKTITIQKSLETIINNEIETFLNNLNNCKNFQDFQLFEKNSRTIVYLIKNIKEMYNL